MGWHMAITCGYLHTMTKVLRKTVIWFHLSIQHTIHSREAITKVKKNSKIDVSKFLKVFNESRWKVSPQLVVSLGKKKLSIETSAQLWSPDTNWGPIFHINFETSLLKNLFHSDIPNIVVLLAHRATFICLELSYY